MASLEATVTELVRLCAPLLSSPDSTIGDAGKEGVVLEWYKKDKAGERDSEESPNEDEDREQDKRTLAIGRFSGAGRLTVGKWDFGYDMTLQEGEFRLEFH